MLIGDIQQRLRPARRRLFDASLAIAKHEASHALAAYACGGTVNRMWFGTRGAAWCRTANIADCWLSAVVSSAGPEADRYFGNPPRTATTDDYDAARAVLQFYRQDDLDTVLDAAEAAARAIITQNLDAVEALAFRFFNAPAGELFQDDIEAVIDAFQPFEPPPPAPMPIAWAQVLARV